MSNNHHYLVVCCGDLFNEQYALVLPKEVEVGESLDLLFFSGKRHCYKGRFEVVSITNGSLPYTIHVDRLGDIPGEVSSAHLAPLKHPESL